MLEAGKVSTNVYLRRIHNFALDMTWLPWPVLAKKRWPAVEFKEKRGITLAEHLAIVARENNPERKAFYKLAWHLGASQSDLAFLEAENVDWDNHVISYKRMKTGTVAIMRFDEDMAEILRTCRGAVHCFRICAPSARATGRRNFTNAALAWASKAFRCTATAMRGRNGRKRRAIPNGMHR